MSEHEPTNDELTEAEVYERVGGERAFLELVERFYERVETDPPLRSLYPEDLEPGRTALGLFFAQRFGGPPVYSAQRGHPRLRMRHAPFVITADGAQRWATHMLAAIDEMGWDQDVVELLARYVVAFTPQMINSHDLPDQTLPLNRG